MQFFDVSIYFQDGKRNEIAVVDARWTRKAKINNPDAVGIGLRFERN